MSSLAEIHLLDHKIRLYQPQQGFRTSLDSVLLAAACPAVKSQKVLDIGCGVGGASFCLLYREAELQLTGIDIQEEYIHIANQNRGLNNRNEKTLFKIESVEDFRIENPQDRFDHVICNPPFYDAGDHIPSPYMAIALARGHIDEALTLRDWIDCAFYNLKSRGSFTIIHQAEKLDVILRDMGKRFGATEIIPIYTKLGRPAKRVIIRSYKDRQTPLILRQAVYLEDASGRQTEEAHFLLREGYSFDNLYQK